MGYHPILSLPRLVGPNFRTETEKGQHTRKVKHGVKGVNIELWGFINIPNLLG